MSARSPGARPRPIHPWPLRLMHWLNALAIIVMVGSGWEIYDASPLFAFTFPGSITIGEWLGGAIAWHLAGMWLLGLNGIAYLTWNALTGRFRRKLHPPGPRAIWRDAVAALTFRLEHRQGNYNAVQRALYLGVIALGALAVASGLAVWKPVELWWLSDLFGGFRVSRYVHFFAMAGIVTFLAVHLVLVVLVPRVLLPMITGGRLSEDVP